MKAKRKVLIALLIVLALPAIALALFVLNGLVLCDGNTPRSGTIAAATPAPEPEAGQLRVLAFNVAKCFVYQGGTDFARREAVKSRLRRLSEIIRSANPDIVCLSEIVRECGPCNVDQVRFIAEHTGLTNWVFGENFSFGFPFYRVVSGNAIISRYELDPVDNVSLAGREPFYITRNNRRALACKVVHPEGDLRIWSLHNDSFDLSNNLEQVEQLLAHPFSENAFMAGDFNARPNDPSMALIRDSGRFTGVFDGPNTFPAIEPSRTIDYVLAPRTWELQEHQVIGNAVSDHCAVLTVFRKSKESTQQQNGHGNPGGGSGADSRAMACARRSTGHDPTNSGRQRMQRAGAARHPFLLFLCPHFLVR